jgi:hypothetical protein
MTDLVEAFRIVVPAVVVPVGVFAGNWAIRYKSEYAQTAASDFLLAVLIFDIVAVMTAKDFEPFVRTPELRQILIHWHIFIGFVGATFWWLIATFGEPKVAAYYSARRNRPKLPIVTLLLCWSAVFVLISLHIGFFFLQGDVHG